MVSGMRTGYPRGLNKGLGSKLRDGSQLRQEGSRVRKEGFRVRKEGSRVRRESSRVRKEGSRVRKEGSRVRKKGSRVVQEIPEEGRRAYRPKCCTDNNKDGDNSPNNADNTNHQASSQTFREMIYLYLKEYG